MFPSSFFKAMRHFCCPMLRLRACLSLSLSEFPLAAVLKLESQSSGNWPKQCSANLHTYNRRAITANTHTPGINFPTGFDVCSQAPFQLGWRPEITVAVPTLHNTKYLFHCWPAIFLLYKAAYIPGQIKCSLCKQLLLPYTPSDLQVYHTILGDLQVYHTILGNLQVYRTIYKYTVQYWVIYKYTVQYRWPNMKLVKQQSKQSNLTQSLAPWPLTSAKIT